MGLKTHCINGHKLDLGNTYIRKNGWRECKTCRRAGNGRSNKTRTKSRPLEYDIWAAMKARCNRKNHKFYSYYGGRGIKVCPKWNNDYRQFLSDMGVRPSKGLLLDRINNDGNYEPSNCRWTTPSVSALNTRRNAKLYPPNNIL